MNNIKLCGLICSVLWAIPSVAQNNEQQGQLVSVEYAKSEQVNPTMWLPGNVISRKNAAISAEQSGQLEWIVEVGAQVEKGQVLAKLDNRHLKLQLAQQQANISKYLANTEYLTKQKGRLSKLIETNHTAISEFERVTKDLAVAKAEVIALQLQIDQTELALEKSELVAPFSGSVSHRYVNEGELLSRGTHVVQLVDTQHLDIKIAAPLTIAPYLVADTKVLVKFQQQLVELPIRTWAQAGDQQTRTFDVRLKADGLNLLAGSAVTVSLPKNATKLATLVPRDALVIRENETFVMTIDEQDKAQKVDVLVGQGVGQWISVIGKVIEGDEVIIRGGERLSLGEKIRRSDVSTDIAKLN